jgi:hypothetical protein
LSAIEAFAGRDIEVAVVPQSVQAMMLSYDHSVAHYDVAHTFSAPVRFVRKALGGKRESPV